MDEVFCMPYRLILLLFIMLVARAVRGLRLRFSKTNDLVRPSSTLPDNFAEIEMGSSIPQHFKSSFLQEMLERGFVHQCTDFKTLDERMSSGVVTAYLGFDATAKSLHVGSLLQIMILRRLQQAGHKPIVLIGGSTTKIGDPTGKDESRKLLSQETIQENISSLSSVFAEFLTFGNGMTDAVMVNNDDWLNSVKYLDFLRDYGRHFTINRMLSFDSVKQRLAREQPFTFLEFNYMLLQAYDFVELNRRYNASLQLGGSDQWGNIVGGVELGRKLNCLPLIGLTAPLITTSDGRKMGKTAAGAVWLNKDMLSEYDYWQFWRNTADSDVIRFLKLFTDLPLCSIKPLEALQGSELNSVKRLLADEATSLLHGRDCLATIHNTVDSLFVAGSGGMGELESLVKVQLAANDIASGNQAVSVVDLLVKAELTPSKSEARRLIRNGGVKVADKRVTDEYMALVRSDFDDTAKVKLSAGKKKHVLIIWPEDQK